ncbi:COG1470 family protein [Paenibacillus alkalitolerans]|uniref:COG1470 family protein n=1 Tax=Paenibacillus alkalitolerans TaxID=2799335 RepID=UPI0018F3EB17|nr:NEW3 domain-containing protein [Paenibacillus alkalitolerans]
MKSFVLRAGFAVLCALLLINAAIPVSPAKAAGELTLFTPQTYIAVTPGESIDYSVELINRTNGVQTARLSVLGLPEGWETELTSGSWKVKELSVKPGENETLSMRVEIPLKVAKGEYRFTLSAGNGNVLPLAVEVTEQGTFETELTTDQSNMEGHADSNFTFSTELRNRTAEKQLYALRAQAAQGWEVVFKKGGDRVSSVEVEPGQSETVTVEVDPPEQVEAGTYDIPISAQTSGTSAKLNLQVVITGSYDIKLTTPSGLLSTDITAGRQRKLELQVQNTGTAELADVNLTADTPVDWSVEFEPATIDTIAPGESKQVIATISSAKSAIAGDYVVQMKASAPEAVSDAQFRVSVKTSVLWGWIGILMIAAVAGGLFYLFRKYGRR